MTRVAKVTRAATDISPKVLTQALTTVLVALVVHFGIDVTPLIELVVSTVAGLGAGYLVRDDAQIVQ